MLGKHPVLCDVIDCGGKMSKTVNLLSRSAKLCKAHTTKKAEITLEDLKDFGLDGTISVSTSHDEDSEDSAASQITKADGKKRLYSPAKGVNIDAMQVAPPATKRGKIDKSNVEKADTHVDSISDINIDSLSLEASKTLILELQQKLAKETERANALEKKVAIESHKATTATTKLVSETKRLEAEKKKAIAAEKKRADDEKKRADMEFARANKAEQDGEGAVNDIGEALAEIDRLNDELDIANEIARTASDDAEKRVELAEAAVEKAEQEVEKYKDWLGGEQEKSDYLVEQEQKKTKVAEKKAALAEERVEELEIRMNLDVYKHIINSQIPVKPLYIAKEEPAEKK